MSGYAKREAQALFDSAMRDALIDGERWRDVAGSGDQLTVAAIAEKLSVAELLLITRAITRNLPDDEED